MSSKLRADEHELWEACITESFEAPYNEEYLAATRKQCLKVRQIVKLTTAEFQELGIRIGHRAELVDVAEEFVMRMTKRAAIVERRRRRQSLLLRRDSNGGIQRDTALQLNFDAMSRSAFSRRANHAAGVPASDASNSGLSVHPLKNAEGVEWISITGWCPTLGKFLSETSDVLTCFGFPIATFHRLFFDNKPMPFVEFGSSFCDGPLVGLLLRVPDITNQDGSSVTVITNRLVVLMSVDENLIISFQRTILDTSEPSLLQEWKEGRHDACDLGLVLERLLRKQLRLYELAVNMLRDTMDEALGLTDEVLAVKRLTLVMKKASVFKRCATASRASLEDLLSRPIYDLLAHNIRTVCDRFRTLESLSSVDLNIALAEFRSSTNLKIFTYITIIAQPIALATGWYGMNFYMPEFHNEDAYYIFTPVVWACSIGFLAIILWRERWLLRLRGGTKQKTGAAGEGEDANRLVSPIAQLTAAGREAADGFLKTLANALAPVTDGKSSRSQPLNADGTATGMPTEDSQPTGGEDRGRGLSFETLRSFQQVSKHKKRGTQTLVIHGTDGEDVALCDEPVCSPRNVAVWLAEVPQTHSDHE
jgi:hypothetical protein